MSPFVGFDHTGVFFHDGEKNLPGSRCEAAATIRIGDRIEPLLAWEETPRLMLISLSLRCLPLVLVVACSSGDNLASTGDAGGGAGGTGGDAPMEGTGDGGFVATGGAPAVGSGGTLVSGGTLATGATSGAGGTTGGSGGTDSTAPLTIWLAGDSTVANGNTPCPTGWGKAFEALFDDLVTVRNSAAGGRSVRTWLYSMTTTMGGDGECVANLDQGGAPVLQERWSAMLEGMKAGDYLFIQFGINDGSPTCDRHVGLDLFEKEYGRMATAAKERGAQPVFLTPASAIKCSGGTAIGTRGGYVTATLDAGETFDVPVIDLHARSVALYQSLGFCPAASGGVSASTTGPVGDFFCDDHTHFSPAGAPAIAALVGEGLLELGLPLAARLK